MVALIASLHIEAIIHFLITLKQATGGVPTLAPNQMIHSWFLHGLVATLAGLGLPPAFLLIFFSFSPGILNQYFKSTIIIVATQQKKG